MDWPTMYQCAVSGKMFQWSVNYFNLDGKILTLESVVQVHCYIYWEPRKCIVYLNALGRTELFYNKLDKIKGKFLFSY